MADFAPACDDAVALATTDGCTVALHDLGGDGEVVLLSHATGFNAHVWQAVADVMAPEFHCLALDYRGYGDSDANDPATLDWHQFGLDACAAAEHAVALNGGTPIAAAGHSMGGAGLLSAYAIAPHLFKALFLFEPIIPPEPTPKYMTSGVRHNGNVLADGARRRRSSFESMDAALANFAAKPPMNTFASAAREGYIRNGFRQNDDGTVTLKCVPEYEARTYETSSTGPRWSELPNIGIPVWVMTGFVEPGRPSDLSHAVHEAIPGSTYVQWDDQGHFGPLEHPEAFGGFLGRTIATLPS